MSVNSRSRLCFRSGYDNTASLENQVAQFQQFLLASFAVKTDTSLKAIVAEANYYADHFEVDLQQKQTVIQFVDYQLNQLSFVL